MRSAASITPGTKVEIGEPGTPSHRTGLVLGIAGATALGRHEDEPSALVSWQSGEQEWVEISRLQVVR